MIKNYSKFEIFSLVRYLQAEGVNSSQISDCFKSKGTVCVEHQTWRYPTATE
jgi:hypothetical protein